MGVLEHCNVTRYGMRGAVVGILPLNECFEFQGLSPLARFGVRSGRICECWVLLGNGAARATWALETRRIRRFSSVRQCRPL